MASVDRAFGFRPVMGYGSSWNGQSISCVIPASDSTAMFVGDMVAMAGGDDTTGSVTTPMPSVKQLSTGGANGIIFGCIVGFKPLYNDLSVKYRLASTLRECYVVLALPGVFFECQMDAAWVAGDSGSTGDYVVGTGNTTTGRSGAEIGTNGTGAAQFTILGPSHTIGEPVDTSAAGTNVIVIPNETLWTNGGAVGV